MAGSPAPPGEGKWLTGESARGDVQKLRATVDAILTSGETVRRDQPSLTIRLPELLEGRQQPWRVVVSDFPETLLLEGPMDRTLIQPRGDLGEILRGLVKKQGVLTVMVEAGGVFSAAMFEAGLVDEVVVYYAPILCGGPLPGLGGCGLLDSVNLHEISFQQFDNDVRLRAVVSSKSC